MNVRTAFAIMFVAALTVWSASTTPASAQEAPVKPGDFDITGIHLFARQAPRYSGANTGDLGGETPAANKPWLRIEVDFSTKPAWSDDLQMKYYVLMGKGREAKLLTGTITHVNIPRGQRHYSAMFLHPNTLDRFGGRVEKVAVMLYYQNRLMSVASEPKATERWWEQYSPTTGFLLPPRETPWSAIAYQRYEAEKAGE